MLIAEFGLKGERLGSIAATKYTNTGKMNPIRVFRVSRGLDFFLSEDFGAHKPGCTSQLPFWFTRGKIVT